MICKYGKTKRKARKSVSDKENMWSDEKNLIYNWKNRNTSVKRNKVASEKEYSPEKVNYYSSVNIPLLG